MLSTNDRFFTIITPSLNKGKFIEQAIQSVLKQNYPYVEHIIVDAGSTDKTLTIIKKYHHIKLLCIPKLGLIESMNLGIQKASGKIIGILNADDFYEPNIFITVMREFQRDQNAYMVVGNCNVLNERDKITRINKPHVLFDEIVQPWKYDWPNNPSSYFYYKKIHRIIGFYKPYAGIMNDYDFLLRFSKKYTLHYIDKTLGNFRIYPGTNTYNNWNALPNIQLQIAKRHVTNVFTLLFYQFYCAYICFYLRDVRRNIVAWLRKHIALRSRIRRFIHCIRSKPLRSTGKNLSKR
jgi:glycosyltransferase involved in cell wall biosynthesis